MARVSPRSGDAPLRRFGAFAAEQAQAWGAAPWEHVGEQNAPSHDRLVECLAPQPGERWLDVATGVGGVAIRAARAGAAVTGVDLAPALVERADELAVQAGVPATFAVGNAERLPYEDMSFDVVSSAFGLIFATDHRATAAELARVLRPGGRVGLTTIHPESPGAAMWRLFWRWSPRPAGAGDPIAWGSRAYVEGLLGDAFELETETVEADPPPEADPERAWAFMSRSFGPIASLSDTLDDGGRARLRADFVEHFRGHAGKSRRYVLVLGTRR